jgi:SAM-dependent methyltransferase
MSKINVNSLKYSDTIRKYSKSSDFYLLTKKIFFNNNDQLLLEALKKNKLYASQPIRKLCKICENLLPSTVDFHSHGIDYVFCVKCSHLNGKFNDSEDFYYQLYTQSGGVEYNSEGYIDSDFHKRAIDIYMPKIDFLISILPPKKYQILDIGCGGGYFVYAALLKNFVAEGIDVSNTSINFGNKQLMHLINSNPLRLESEEGFFDAIKNSNADIISAIGVLEHIRKPQKFFEAFRKSNAQFLYYSVPMFSFSVILENIFKEIFPRQLSVDHTHLFTENSISKMNELIGVRSIAEWRFGTDAIDLYRHSLLSLSKNNSSQKMIDYLNFGLGEIKDELQAVFDRHHFSSEIHCITAKIPNNT